MISVVIPIKDYSSKLDKCLKSLAKNDYKSFEVVLVCQEDTALVRQKLSSYKLHIRLVHATTANLSKAYNIGIGYSRGQIAAIISEDCYPRRDWLAQINKTLNIEKNFCVTGNTYAYTKNRRPNESCYCTFVSAKPLTIVEPKYHAKYIGFSNNFAINKKYVKKIGLFREVFAPGSLGVHGCDADLFLRILIDKVPIIHNPRMVVWHDHWMDFNVGFNKNLQYIGGEVACYGLYALKGYEVGRKVLFNNFVKTPYKELKKAFLVLKNGGKKRFLRQIYSLAIETSARISGLVRAFLIYLSGY